MSQKIKVFLDTNILVLYSRKDKRLKRLFSKEVIEKVQFVINPIVFQELIFVNKAIEEKIKLNMIKENVKIFPISIDMERHEIKNLNAIRNHLIHTNDILILNTALEECDYLLTMDLPLLRIEKLGSLKIIRPEEFFGLLGIEP